VVLSFIIFDDFFTNILVMMEKDEQLHRNSCPISAKTGMKEINTYFFPMKQRILARFILLLYEFFLLKLKNTQKRVYVL
jgi:hypothetical protein